MFDARRIALPFAAGMALLSLSACGSKSEQNAPEASSAPESKPGVAISGGKLVLPAVSGNPGAAYFAVDNQGTGTVSIAAVSIEGAGKAEIHQTMGGEMKPVDRIDVEPKTSVAFQPGGLHVMAFDIADSVKVGGEAEVTVTFADGDKVSAPLKVEAMGAGAMDGMNH